jgi:hypothetical protein
MFAPPHGHHIANNFDSLIRLRETFERLLPIPLDYETELGTVLIEKSSVSWSCRFLVGDV